MLDKVNHIQADFKSPLFRERNIQKKVLWFKILKNKVKKQAKLQKETKLQKTQQTLNPPEQLYGGVQGILNFQ